MNLAELEDGDVSATAVWSQQAGDKDKPPLQCTIMGCAEPVVWCQAIEWTIGELRNSTQLYWCKEHAQAYSPKEGDKEG